MSSENEKKTGKEGREPSLEQSLTRLEKIVEQLESGEADLEKSIGLYTEGKKLGESALKRLDALERRIQIVTDDDGKNMEVEDFQ